MLTENYKKDNPDSKEVDTHEIDISDYLTEPKPKYNDAFTAAIIILVSLVSFGLGRLSKIKENKTSITINNTENANLGASVGLLNYQIAPKNGEKGTTVNNAINNQQSPQGAVVGSKNGSKYHFPWCSGAQRISEANKVWFESIESAKKAGYTPAGNCKGLE